MESLPLAEVRSHLSKLVEKTTTTHMRYTITRNGRDVAILMSSEDYESIQETMDVLSDVDLLHEIQNALAEVKNGNTVTHEQVLADLDARRTSNT